MDHNWLLPEYFEDLLPPEAEQIEQLRRKLLDHFHSFGYVLVQPPLLEHLDSLLTGAGRELDLRTFKVVDQLSGRLLGLRADMTQQVARIDAHLLNEEGITRLCYAGSVLHTLPAGLHQSRELIQIGAELYGHPGIESDREVLELLLSSLNAIGITSLHVDLGHVAVFHGLAREAKLDPVLSEKLFSALQSKDRPALQGLSASIAEPWRSALRKLPELYGDAREVLEEAKKSLPRLDQIEHALAQLGALIESIDDHQRLVQLDLTEVSGDYHTGVVFACYARGQADAIARGGRYDDIGRVFGRARPATGFTLYPRQLLPLARTQPMQSFIVAPAEEDSALSALIQSLRAQGHVVIRTLAGSQTPRGDRHILKQNGRWEITGDGSSVVVR